MLTLFSLLDTGTSALVSYGTYEYMVSYFDQPWDKYLTIPPYVVVHSPGAGTANVSTVRSG